MLDVRIHDKHQIEFKTHYHFEQQEVLSLLPCQ